MKRRKYSFHDFSAKHTPSDTLRWSRNHCRWKAAKFREFLQRIYRARHCETEHLFMAAT